MEIKYGRKRSGIKKELIEKVEEWLLSIKDERVRKLAEEDVIVTGGSIASMLLGEKINDFDVYFKTQYTTVEIAKYYLSEFKVNNKNSGMSVEQSVIKNCKGVAESRVTISILSGGIAEEDKSEDTGVFAKEDKYRPAFLSQNAITLSDKFQIIIRFYGTAESIHDNYDFVHAMCYWDHSEKKLELPAEALESLMCRNLIYRGSLYPIASIFRMKKFVERGWRITAGQQLKIMWQISELDLTNYQVLTEQLTGVDMAYMHALITALKDVSSDKINSTYICSIIDKIFD